MSGTNREYKDRLFKFIFGNPENKAWTLSLYNAVNNSSYTNEDDIVFTTIETAVYMSMKNDVSFLVDEVMSFYEQQSSFNPNLPLRFYIYGGMAYSSYIEMTPSYHRFSSKLQKLPAPKCVCFYNGTDVHEDVKILKLSDSFPEGSKPDIEVRVTMLNINYGCNKKLMEQCRPLGDYSMFVNEIRMVQAQGNTLETAIDTAMNKLPETSLIKPFLIKNKAEVKRMCITEYDEERTISEMREEAKEEGRTEGLELGIVKTLIALVKDGILTLADAAARANMTITEFEQKAAQES